MASSSVAKLGLAPGLSLGSQLFREAQPEFFGILVSRNASLYLDALDSLERTLSRTGTISRTEAVEIIIEVISNHPEFDPNQEGDDNSSESATLSGQATLVLRRLLETRWLHEPQRTDYQRLITLDPYGEILLAALRQIAKGSTAQFTDKIQIACSTILNQDAFTDQPLSDLEACLANLQAGLRELRQMQKSIDRYMRHLTRAQSLREIQQVLFDEFSENIGHACYRELIRAKLPTRLLHARSRLQAIAGDEAVLDKMQAELLRRNTSVDPTDALNLVRLKLEDLAQLLDSVGPQANEIDDRTAEFARRSVARFRYLREVSSGHRERIQRIFEWINSQNANRRITDLSEQIELPRLLICEAGLLSGDSLYTPRLRRSLLHIDPIGDDVSDAQREAALTEIHSNLLNSLNVSRANQFVERLPGNSHASIHVTELPIHNEDDISDVIACLLHTGARDARFSVQIPRVQRDAEKSEQVNRVGFLIEEFIIEKK